MIKRISVSRVSYVLDATFVFIDASSGLQACQMMKRLVWWEKSRSLANSCIPTSFDWFTHGSLNTSEHYYLFQINVQCIYLIYNISEHLFFFGSFIENETLHIITDYADQGDLSTKIRLIGEGLWLVHRAFQRLSSQFLPLSHQVVLEKRLFFTEHRLLACQLSNKTGE